MNGIQFNIKVPKSSVSRVKKEAATHGTTQNVIVFVALENFFTRHAPDKRREFYKEAMLRPYGRVKA